MVIKIGNTGIVSVLEKSSVHFNGDDSVIEIALHWIEVGEMVNKHRHIALH